MAGRSFLLFNYESMKAEQFPRCLAVALLLVAGWMVSCSPRIVEKVRTEYIYKDRVRVDTTWLKDSVYIREWIKGDTIRIVEYRDHLVYQYRMLRDTVMVRDSVAVESIREVQVEKSLTWWQKFRLRAFWWLLGGVAGCCVWIWRKPLLALLNVWIG